jgi:proteasome accessory factor B
MSDRLDRLERLVNLVIALRETRLPLTVEQVNERVAGYGGPRDDSWRRMFERDKAELRALGVPVRTERVSRYSDDVGYRIDARDYDLPSIALQPDEITALALAAQVTGMADDAAPALDKLAVDAGVPGAHRVVAPPRLRYGLDASGPVRAARDALVDAVAARQRVRFAYRRAGDVDAAAGAREVEPHALVHRSGRWYLRGRDVGRDADRTFRLDRIRGPVRPVGEPGAYALPEGGVDPDDVVPDEGPRTDAVVLADPSVAWAVARRARGAGEPVEGVPGREGWRRFALRGVDPDELLGWVLASGPGVELVEPVDLRARLLAHLRAVAGDPS